jgi:thioredoxin 1
MFQSQSGVVPVNEINFEDEVLKSELPVFIDVSAAWCGPCKAAAPIVEAIARTAAGRLKVVVIDGGECPDLVAKLGVRGFPTFLGVVGGSVVRSRAGFAGKKALEAFSEEVSALH